ncbi:hypothetical protein C8A03DRAFT_30266 [Achaetomium macrosporum]|uniref:Uncharacterized protein n=1 Tax=Achaetomium macrosporum TaxID=79813 RepID=A0AAN7CG87_9PEZI|nr:hypothetical protein C8A03DRAFT_30266 [Achaetomium macrosporum]
MLALFTVAWLLAWMPLAVQADDEPRTCVFRLLSGDFVLSQLDGGQVLGIRTTDLSNEGTGTLFRLRHGVLYDSKLRGCWWAVLVCDLFPPAHPHPLFEIDATQKLVYNSSFTSFWACPANAGNNNADAQQQQQQQGGETVVANFYLEVPEHLQERFAADQARSSGPCKRVAIEVGFIDAWICDHEFAFAEESASERRTAVVAPETIALDTASVPDASVLVAAAKTVVLGTATALEIASVPASSESGTVATFAPVASTTGTPTSVISYTKIESVL